MISASQRYRTVLLLLSDLNSEVGSFRGCAGPSELLNVAASEAHTGWKVSR